jgi:arabinose-5-phosphate isomerase
LKKVQSQVILKLAKEVILLEAETLSKLASSLNDSFIDAITTICTSKGRIIVTGVGKSALIGKKMVATFNSINMPSIFLHASDALHGDLGSIQPQDTVICLSKSGETSELKALLPVIMKKGNPVIAIVAQIGSYLARHADVTIITPIEREADSNNLTPTNSTIAQMAVGDALAVSIMHVKGFKSDDFALLHPGGMLGKQLNMLVKDLIDQHECPAVSLASSIDEVIMEISSKRLGATAVLGEGLNICGVITDGDLRRMLQRKVDYRHLTARDIMTVDPKVIGAEEKATQALDQIRKYNITQLLVVSDTRYIGVIHIHDLLREGF